MLNTDSNEISTGGGAVQIPRLYREDPLHKMPRTFLEDEVYARAIESLIIACADTVVIDPRQRTFFLVKRTIKPMAGLWVIGGRRIAGETPLESAERCFKRETGLDLGLRRFRFAAIQELLWKDREQSPQGAGSHNLSYTFTAALSAEERASAAASLDGKEYEKGFGLREFDRDALVKANVNEALIDLYDIVFS